MCDSDNYICCAVVCAIICFVKSIREVGKEILAEGEPISLAENWKHYSEYVWSTAPSNWCYVCQKERCMFERELEAARQRLNTQELELERTTESYKQAIQKNMPATAKVMGAKMKRYEFAVALSRETVKELEAAVKVAPKNIK